MSDSKSKTPTPRDRQLARQNGRVALSSDLAIGIGLIGSVTIVYWNSGRILQAAKNALATHLSTATVDVNRATELSSDVYQLIRIVAECGVSILAFVIVTWMIQTGAMFAVARITPDLSRASPVTGLTRLFSMTNVTQACFNLLKIIALTATLAFFLRSNYETIAATGHAHIDEIALRTGSVFYELLIVCLGLMIVLGAFDYVVKRNRFETSLTRADDSRPNIRPIVNDPSASRKQS